MACKTVTTPNKECVCVIFGLAFSVFTMFLFVAVLFVNTLKCPQS